MSGTYGDSAAFRAAIGAQLASLPPAAAEAIAGGMGAGEDAYRAEPPRPGATALNLRLGRYVIRDEDLPVITTIGSVAAALAATSGTAGIAWPTLIPALTGLATLAWNMWRKGVLLSPEQLRVLGLLQGQGPASAETLAPLAARPGAGEIAESALDGVLRSLKEVETRDGTLVALATQDAAGLWRARGV